jgi:hypothetical protein
MAGCVNACDPAFLEAAAPGLLGESRSLGSVPSSLRASLEACAGACGSPILAGAVRSFRSHLGIALDTLALEYAALATALEVVAEAFRQAGG